MITIDNHRANDEGLVCAICWDVFAHPITLVCQHTFCSACLRTLEDDNLCFECPTCRTQISPERVEGNENGVIVNQLETRFPEQYRMACESRPEESSKERTKRLRARIALREEQLKEASARNVAFGEELENLLLAQQERDLTYRTFQVWWNVFQTISLVMILPFVIAVYMRVENIANPYEGDTCAAQLSPSANSAASPF